MQDRYVGDIGDFLKLSLLEVLSVHHRLGIAWWRQENESHNNDGKHIAYLEQPSKWRKFSPDVYDFLNSVVQTERSISKLEEAPFLRFARFNSLPVPLDSTARAGWVKHQLEEFSDRTLVFFDPDSGLAPDSHTLGTKEAGKSIRVEELALFKAPRRSLVVYHHQSRRPGGHLEEIRYWSDRLQQPGFDVHAIRCKAYSPRVYFVLDADLQTQTTLRSFCKSWGENAVWDPHL